MPDSIDCGGVPAEDQKQEDMAPPLSAPSGADEPIASPAVPADRPITESLLSADTHARTVCWIYRHTLPVRLAHWINVFCLPILIMSGFQIFNAHPALYWGERSDRDRPILRMDAAVTESGEIRGITMLFGHVFDTTGFFGASKDSDGEMYRRGFPAWATLPSHQWLAMGRRWHLFFAWVFVINGLLFGLYSLISRHLNRDLFPSLKDLRGIGRAMLDHLLFRHPMEEQAARYNVLQKIAYTGVVFGFGPLIVLSGMAMSPRLDAAFPGLLTLFGGRQSARTVHFITCFAFIGYTLVHLFMVTVTGLWNNLRSMLIGRYRITEFGEANHEPGQD